MTALNNGVHEDCGPSSETEPFYNEPTCTKQHLDSVRPKWNTALTGIIGNTRVGHPISH